MGVLSWPGARRVLVAFGLSLLSGYGAVALAGLAPGVRRRAVLVYAALAAAGLLGVGYTIRMANDLVVSDVRLASGIAIGLLVLAAGIGMTWRRHTSPTHPPWGWLALVVVDLFIAGFTLNLAPRGDLPPATALAVAAANQTPDDRVPGRTHNEDVLFENYGMFVGVEELSGNSPLRLAR